MKILFIYLKAFSFTGGIEKFNRSFLKALHELSIDGYIDADSVSSYDKATDEKYFPKMRFYGHGGLRILSVIHTFFKSFRYDTIILGHINLAIVGILIKRFNPSARIIVIVHGIEVWDTLHGFKKKMLEQADMILAVSNFTKEKMIAFNSKIVRDRVKIFPNTIDPYFASPVNFSKPAYLLRRYGLSKDTPVLLTVTRLASSEKYKGYDEIIESMPDLLKENGELKYFLCGRADRQEKDRIQALIEYNKLTSSVTLPGYIDDAELIDHYLLADVFIMQSKKEGFGIVFIEALACGRKVIAGDKDGSPEALLEGELGKLIDPDNKDQLRVAIGESLRHGPVSSAELQAKVTSTFGFHRYKDRLKNYLINEA